MGAIDALAVPPGAFRQYPTRAGQQQWPSQRDVCRGCLGGTCCVSEDPIHLTAFDILRLAALLDITPAEFLLKFTQDRFGEEDSESRRRRWIDDPESSTVTFLRRRANHAVSPCIFLKYVRDDDGTVRRICGVHPGRPLACREYYYDTCKTRWTGELAALQAHGLEALRDGQWNAAAIEAELCRLTAAQAESGPMSAQLALDFWTEMSRASRWEECNEEGAAAFDLTAFQDPLDDKLNRLLSKKHLRREEHRGPVPHGEQLDPFVDGNSFARGAERARLLRIAAAPPRHGLFERGSYRHYSVHRLLQAGMEAPAFFATMSAEKKKALLATIPVRPLFAGSHLNLREIYRAALAACDALVHFASYVARIGDLPELGPAGSFEFALLHALQRLETSAHPCLAQHPQLIPVKVWARRRIRQLYGKVQVSREPSNHAVLLPRWIGQLERVAHTLSRGQRCRPGLAAKRESVDRLCQRALATCGSLMETGNTEAIAVVSFSLRSLGCGYATDPRQAELLEFLLERQRVDGSWETDPAADRIPESQGDFLRQWLCATANALDALRPLRIDLLNPANHEIGLV
jgi:Fe-S-cluster containining protein